MIIYYTLQIHYGTLAAPEIYETKDLAYDTGSAVAEHLWRERICERIYAHGFVKQTSPGTWELISPLQINTAFLIKQDKKFGV